MLDESVSRSSSQPATPPSLLKPVSRFLHFTFMNPVGVRLMFLRSYETSGRVVLKLRHAEERGPCAVRDSVLSTCQKPVYGLFCLCILLRGSPVPVPSHAPPNASNLCRRAVSPSRGWSRATRRGHSPCLSLSLITPMCVREPILWAEKMDPPKPCQQFHYRATSLIIKRPPP